MNYLGKWVQKKLSQRPNTADVSYDPVAEEAVVVPPIKRRVAYSVDVSFAWNADEL